MRDQLGLTRIQRCYTGGAPLGPDVFRFFHSIGVNLKQIYGQTEICGIAVMHTDDDVKFATVGKPCPGTEMRIADNGEILLKSKAVFHGYYNNEAATAETVDSDGWLHTGDAGYLDEHGHLVVIDRAKDVMEMPDGTRFSPAFIENKLKFSPYVEEAVVFWQDGSPDITAILTIEPSTVGSWAEHRRLGYTTYTDLAGKAEVRELLSEEVARANEDLPESVQGAALRPAPQAVRPRRRRDHPDPQGPPPGHQRALRRHHRRARGGCAAGGDQEPRDLSGRQQRDPQHHPAHREHGRVHPQAGRRPPLAVREPRMTR